MFTQKCCPVPGLLVVGAVPGGRRTRRGAKVPWGGPGDEIPA